MNIDEFNKSKSPLLLEGWLEFNKLKWAVAPFKLNWSLEGKAFPNVKTVWYLNKRGKIILPPLNPYIGLEFSTTNTQKIYNIYNQWIKVSDYLSGEMKKRRLANMLMLPPGIEDSRSWIWNRFHVGVKYTYKIKFPYEIHLAQTEVRTNIRKAIKRGFVAERSNNLKDVYNCLLDTEKRQSFSHNLSLEDLNLLFDLLGENHLRTYLCYAPNGEVASATICLHRDDGYAIGWIRGTKEEYLTSGAAVYLDQVTIDDLQKTKAKGIDFCGANIRNIAKAKRKWGGHLVPFYSLEEYSLITMAKNLRNMWLFRK
ncbi:hypothetical protein CIB95_08490 [Lottiidibacillus patelloidae]|uniref:BioF2-like acetyltransferase domain-containing protein n=1 Tax=Lottiidibacillus patelloidae TaxID=2670334 RepID=A0A263BVA0_9BACI|nr:hypothetical protein [Lottiidibacillus patelloidae]OZM57482.1 hypothetical protein CIB95_08490 [Lottiidibacillus patelloidae]